MNTNKSPQSDDDAQRDLELLDRARAGDLRAFDALVMLHNKRVYGLIYRMTQNREDAYDLVQDVFAKAYQSLSKFKGKSSFYTWVYSIAVNMTLNHLKKAKRRDAHRLDDEKSGLADTVSMPDHLTNANPRRELDRKILQKKMNDALLELSEDHRTVVILADIQSVPQVEISRILGVSEGTVRSRLFYTHKQLQSKLEEFKSQLS